MIQPQYERGCDFYTAGYVEITKFVPFSEIKIAIIN